MLCFCQLAVNREGGSLAVQILSSRRWETCHFGSLLLWQSDENKGPSLPKSKQSDILFIKVQNNLICATFIDTGLQSSDKCVDLVGSTSWLYWLHVQWRPGCKVIDHFRRYLNLANYGHIWFLDVCLRWKQFVLTHCIQKFKSDSQLKWIISIYKYLQNHTRHLRSYFRINFDWIHNWACTLLPTGMQKGVGKIGCHFGFLSVQKC